MNNYLLTNTDLLSDLTPTTDGKSVHHLGTLIHQPTTMNLTNVTALFADPDQKAPVITKQHLKTEIYEAYQASQHQLQMAREELLPAGILGFFISLLLVGALTN